MTRSTTDPYHAVRHFSAAPWPGPRGELVRLTSDAVESIIAPADGCRLVSLRAFGHELLRQWDPERRAFQYGSFPMIPWVGRLDCGILRYQRREYHLPVNKPPHALHGMACFGPWQQQGVGSFSYRLDDPWPWPGTVTQTFDVLADGLATTLTVTSDEATFPAAAGWHPWFRRQLDEAHGPDQALQIDVMPGWQEEAGADELPTGRRISPRPGPWDDCFGFGGTMSATLRWPGSVQMEMTSDGSFMTLFTVPKDAACVEPLTGPPNGVNTQPRLVTPDNPLTITTTWLLRDLSGTCL